ncbi:MAG TPA: hypothetical protein EYG11_22735 [Candidatus Latescibacteria bacterium]|nr:hypothetical protein [Candidatus Handelsmanbacteria bacterium]HIL11516.1 hypothetical protein [Candidatus Latescibacterota bacterium]
MRIWISSLLCSVPLVLMGCGHELGYRHFAGPILPAADVEQAEQYVVRDDHSITFVKDRLEITLLPLTVEMLNRQLAGHSQKPEGFHEPNPYLTPTNPYTYGEWKPGWEEEHPTRFTVFALKVKNYEYPKVSLDPLSIEITVANGRHYESYSRLALDEYFSIYAIGYAGNTFLPYRERRDVILRTLYPADEMVFSGQETQGFIAFAPLASDVEVFDVRIKGVVLRFDYRDQPVETVDITYSFKREVYLAKERRAEGS